MITLYFNSKIANPNSLIANQYYTLNISLI
jgi:hypothetical protein